MSQFKNKKALEKKHMVFNNIFDFYSTINFCYFKYNSLKTNEYLNILITAEKLESTKIDNLSSYDH